MPLKVTALYAFLLAIIYVGLLLQVGPMRGKLNIPLGDGGNKDLLTAMRRHGNFIETAPIALALMAIIEINGAGKMWLHGIGILLVAGRAIHPFGLDTVIVNKPARIAGMAATMLATVIAAVTAGWQGLLA